MKTILKYFPELTENQIDKFEKLEALYLEWNAKINVISRKDTSNFYLHHVLHSLSIAKVCQFKPNIEVLDVGTGGGFPGIPLAILFPETNFFLVDSIGKKIKVVEAVAQELNLKNVKYQQVRAEQINQKFDFVVSRAVTDFSTFYDWVSQKFSKIQYHDLANGIIYLKGGDLKEEMKRFENQYIEYKLTDFFEEDFFETKKIIYLPVGSKQKSNRK